MLHFPLVSSIRHFLTASVAVLGVSLGGAGVAQAQVVSNGATLYANNCAKCHGASPATGAIRIQLGVNSAVIQNAIAAFAVMRGSNLVALTATDLADIAAFIAADVAGGGTTPPVAPAAPTTAVQRGQALYGMCVACHGATPATGYEGIRKATTSTRILNAINKVGVMRGLGLNAAQSSDLAAYVVASLSGTVTSAAGPSTATGATTTTSTSQAIASSQQAATGAPQYPALTVAGGCTLGRTDQPLDPLWLLMLAGAIGVLGLRRSAKV
ncbi:MAG: c-type cytochrome [Leptothrix ochracea]|uniref:c-type cytochrome n=1 Tax=Leptothrix ochracea TaxID=735331 RepID=UPI0034E2EE60